MRVKNQVQLITYPDSLGGNLKNLNSILTQYFLDIFDGGVHIVSPFKSTSNQKAAPLSYFEIEPKFGTWEDIRTIGRKFDVLLDINLEHIFDQSQYYNDVLIQTENTKVTDFIMTLNKLLNGGKLIQDDTDKLREVFIEFFTEFSKNNVKIIRVNVSENTIEKLKSSYYFDEAKIYKYLEWISKTANFFQIELLAEINTQYLIKYKLVEHGYWIYDLDLSHIILDAIISKSNQKLYKFLENRPYGQFTILDCKNEADSNKAECSYYYTLNCDVDAYLAAKAIQFFVPGIPQVYLEDLLNGKNAEKADVSVDISRHVFSRQDIEASFKKQVVQRIFKLIRFRNEYPAFNGKFKVMSYHKDEVHFSWENENKYCKLLIDFKTNKAVIDYIDDDGRMACYLI